MLNWDYYQFPVRLAFEAGAMQRIADLTRKLGSRSLLLTANQEIAEPALISTLQSSLEEGGMSAILYEEIKAQAEERLLDTLAYFAKKSQVDMIIAIGDRNTFLTARTVALLAANHIFARDLPGSQLPLRNAPLPLITAPAIPSLGEEISAILHLHQPQSGETFYACHEQLFPVMTIVDPNLSEAVAPHLLVRASAACLCLAIEALLSRKPNEIINAVALRAVELLAVNLLLLFKDPSNRRARTSLYMASLLTGMAHSNDRLGLGYSLAAAIQNLADLDFYTALTILLPHIMEFYLTTSATSYVQICRALGENIQDLTLLEVAIKAVEKIRKTFLELKIPHRISHFEIEKDLLPKVAQQAANISFSKNSPQQMSLNDIENILIAAY